MPRTFEEAMKELGKKIEALEEPTSVQNLQFSAVLDSNGKVNFQVSGQGPTLDDWITRGSISLSQLKHDLKTIVAEEIEEGVWNPPPPDDISNDDISNDDTTETPE